ncbi:hypothetical protein [Clostridium mediterraneense]|uniref:hypothetical protein n=1 Tax=Clostridium mediterraneense TaxID=1805472 RepID=UPI00082C0BC8|nr:hypothetical protein [Clostridium mediterraneense]
MKNKKNLQTILVIIGITLQMLGLLVYKLMDKKTLSIIFTIAAIGLIVISFFVLSKDEKHLEDIEINDERNTLIRYKAHFASNNIMIFIKLFITILMIFLNYYWVALLIASLSILEVIIICSAGEYYNKHL